MAEKPQTNGMVKPFSIVGRALRATFRRMWPLFGLLLLVSAGAMAAELAPPLLLRQIIDGYLKHSLTDGLLRLALFYLGALILSSSLGFAQTMVTTTIGQNVLLDLRLLMARHLARLPMRYYNTPPVGETMSRLTADVEAVNTLFSAGLINAIADMFKVAGIVAAMVTISPLLCGITLLAAPGVYWLARFFGKHIYQAQLGVRRSVGEINTFLQETFAGVRTLKAFGQEEPIKDRFEGPLHGNLQALNHEAVYVAYFPCVMQLVRALTIAVVIWLGARLGFVDAGAIGLAGLTVGSLAAFADLIGRLFGPIESLAQEFQTIQRAMAGLQRIAELLQIPPEERGETQHIAALPDLGQVGDLLTVEGVQFGYQPGQAVLRGVALIVRRGSKAALVGRTGAGKTTLLNLIAGLYRPAEGHISICGYDPHSLDPASRRKLLGVVPQTVHVFEGTVQENITLRDEAIPLDDVMRAAQTVGLHDTIVALPEGYQTRLGEADGKLSYGQTQLLALARAIVTDPPLLLLDEPTSGLDAVTERAVFDAFRAAGESRTILTISHRLSGVLDADLVHIMANGQIRQSGQPEALA
ncbi:MAG: ABC transporter ATP-binding protein, partial [Anaerolineae bacterium]|nr:ABC transporter ATP-binding protein [Anaerolineae bacterium]